MTTPSNENKTTDNAVNNAETPGQGKTADEAAGSPVSTATAPLSEPQRSDDAGIQGALDAVQDLQDEADSKGHFGVRIDPRPLSDYSVEGSVRRAESGDTTSLPQP